MDAMQALKTRRSVRSYKTDPVPRETIEAILEVGRLAATARNEQFPEFVVVTDAMTRARIAGITEYGKFISQAPVCVAVLCRDGKYYLEDGSAATQNILVAARAHELGSCWVARDKKPYADKIRKLVGAPEGYRLVSLVAIGHSLENPEPVKRPLADVVHWEKF